MKHRAFLAVSVFACLLVPTVAPADTARRIFQPFARGDAERQGLGLGLYIASEIARAHQGALTVSSDDKETRFTFSIPR